MQMQLLEEERVYNVHNMIDGKMHDAVNTWDKIYKNMPTWADNEDIQGYGFAKMLCTETARLTTLALGISVEGSTRADYIQQGIPAIINALKTEQCEYACAYGHIVLKLNGEKNGLGIDYLTPLEYVPVGADEDGYINAAVFRDKYHEEGSSEWYTRLEYQRFERQVPESDEAPMLYHISNRAYKAAGAAGNGVPIPIEESPWNTMEEETYIEKLDTPLFAVFAMPTANNIVPNHKIKCSIYSNAINELRDLDISMTRLSNEQFDSQKKIFMGDMLVSGNGIPVRQGGFMGAIKDKIGKILPRYVHILPGSNVGDEYHESVPTLLTEQRKQAVDHYLNLIGVKCGYSAGQFVLDGKSGMITATQVESDDRETIQLIKQIRDSLQDSMDRLIKAIDAYISIYNIAPVGTYEVNYDFGDITYNWEEDRQRHWQYVQSGKYPLWKYYVKFEGMTEEEAKALVAEAKSEQQETDREGLFD